MAKTELHLSSIYWNRWDTISSKGKRWHTFYNCLKEKLFEIPTIFGNAGIDKMLMIVKPKYSKTSCRDHCSILYRPSWKSSLPKGFIRQNYFWAPLILQRIYQLFKKPAKEIKCRDQSDHINSTNRSLGSFSAQWQKIKTYLKWISEADCLN